MGALYEDVEKFFGDIFAQYGRFLAHYPVVFIVISLLTSILLGLGLVNIHYENDVEALYAPMGSQAVKDRARVAKLFPDATGVAYYPHQVVNTSTFAEVIFVSKQSENENVIEEANIEEIKQLYTHMLGITLAEIDRGLSYDTICAGRDKTCIVTGLAIVEGFERTGCLNSTDFNPVVTDATGYVYHTEEVLAGVSAENHCLKAKAMKLRFNLKHDTPKERELSVLWEKIFIKRMSFFESDNLDFAYSVSESLDIELAEHLGKDTKFFSLTIVIMVVYATFVTSGGNWVSSRMLLAQAGIVAGLLAILASFGLMSMCGMVFVDICGVMPFLVLGVGVDDMFILMSGWRRTDLRCTVEERMSETFRTSAISVTITSLTDLLAFCIGATSPYLSVKNFCISAGVAVLFCYINHLTFFAGCMVLHARRVLASRHCLTCLRTSTRKTLVEQGKYGIDVICCHGEPPRRLGQEDSLCERIPTSVLPRFLLHETTKIFVILLFLAYLGVSVWGASQIKTGLKLESVVPSSSYLSKYLDYNKKYYPNMGPAVMFVITDPVRYRDMDVQMSIDDILNKARGSGYIYSNYEISWLSHFKAYLRDIETPPTTKDFIRLLQRDFLSDFPEYTNDIRFSENGAEIVASRFYVRSKQLNDSFDEGNMMLKMRELAHNSSLPFVPFCTQFTHYEHSVSILKNTLLAVGVAFIGMLFIAVMFIPHPISITLVTVSMVTIVLGMFAFMHFWGLELSAITNVQIILSVGFCVDFTVHISHAFMTATGKNRKERVIRALERVGIPLLNGGFSSILGVLVLAFANSYVFRSFFKTMILVIILGLAHALLLLPVILSVAGPKRTSKPTVFIPIAANWAAYHAKKPAYRPNKDSLGDQDMGDFKQEGIELMQMETPAEERRRLVNGDQEEAGPSRPKSQPIEKRWSLLDEDIPEDNVVEVRVERNPETEKVEKLRVIPTSPTSDMSDASPSFEDLTTVTSISETDEEEKSPKTKPELPVSEQADTRVPPVKTERPKFRLSKPKLPLPILQSLKTKVLRSFSNGGSSQSKGDDSDSESQQATVGEQSEKPARLKAERSGSEYSEEQQSREPKTQNPALYKTSKKSAKPIEGHDNKSHDVVISPDTSEPPVELTKPKLIKMEQIQEAADESEAMVEIDLADDSGNSESETKPSDRSEGTNTQRSGDDAIDINA